LPAFAPKGACLQKYMRFVQTARSCCRKGKIKPQKPASKAGFCGLKAFLMAQGFGPALRLGDMRPHEKRRQKR
jgi:hypothetical protein